MPSSAAILFTFLVFILSTYHAAASPTSKHIIRFRNKDARSLYLRRLSTDFPHHTSVHLLDDIFIGAIIAHNNDVALEEEERMLRQLHVLSADPESEVDLIEHFERDQIVRVEDSYQSPHQGRTQQQAPWHLDRLCKDSLPLTGTFDYVQHNHGSPVNIYIVDTGIRTSHEEFQGRARAAFSTQPNLQPGEDCHGHGTHTAALSAGRISGVNKNAIVHDVRVMDCFGSGANSDIVRGLDWIAKHAQKPAVVNMSFGGRISEIVDLAVKSLFEKGILPVVAAGNEGVDACQRSPARVEESLTVGASTKEDFRAPFSNLGPCVDVFAPGMEIESASHLSDTEFSVLSGTSMSAPLVSGIAAALLSQYVDITPAQLKARIIEYSLQGVYEEIRPLVKLPSKDVCPQNFGGNNCTIAICGNYLATNEAVCGGHGSCTAPQKCECESGYHGQFCESFTCAGISHENSTEVCSGRGSCVAPDTCECNNGWSGERCEVAPPVKCFERATSDPAVCGGHGQCVAEDKCACAPGYSGEDCSVYQCFGRSSFSTRACSGRGDCVAPNKCTCKEGFFGFECETQRSRGGDIPDQLVAIIATNSTGSAPQGGIVVDANTAEVQLHADASFDARGTIEEALSYEWTCTELTGDSRLTNRCAEVRGNTKTLRIESTLLNHLRDGHYEITLLVSKDTRREYASIAMSVVDSNETE